jgi:glyoxylase-like metal-dependent hydrolase (beta-lactamase superfamily II)
MKIALLLSTCLILAACSSSEDAAQAPVESPKADTTQTEMAAPVAPVGPEVKIYAMNCGDMAFSDVDLFADDGSMKGVSRDFVDPCYLIRHPAGDLIWDTGVPEGIADMPEGVRPEGFPVHIVVKKKLSAQLAELGLTPADIEFLSFSHLHFDHTGNGNLFAASTWIVDADERAAMFADAVRTTDEFGAYSALENAQTVLIEGDESHDVFGDGSVVIYQTPGHTPGSTTLLVRTVGSGNVLLTGDMWHLAESRERHLVPSFNYSREQTLASMDGVEALATLNDARVVRQHVPGDFAALPTFPTPLQ